MTLAAAVTDVHRHEKAIVAAEADVQRATADEARVRQRAELVATEAMGAREAIEGLDARQAEAHQSIDRLTAERTTLDVGLGDAQRRLADTRDHAQSLSQRAAEARAQHAGLAERALAAIEKAALGIITPKREFHIVLQDLQGDIVRRPTNITFGGPDMRTAYVGSLRGPFIPTFQAPEPGLPLIHQK